MARRLLVVATLLAFAGCKDKKDDKPAAPAGVNMDVRCEQLAKACGDKDKHVAKIVEECRKAAMVQVEKKCLDKALAEYDCYEKELCGGADKVWAIGDLGVLAERRSKCVAERNASRECGK